MAYDFHENFEVIVPDFRDQLTSFSEAAYSKNHGLVIEIAAIHAGATANFNHYSADELAKAVNTWLEPYPKPIIMNHDPHSEAVGRVMGAKMDKEADGTPFTRLQVGIMDPAAIKKVADGRYLTGSVGGKAEEAVCSVCQTNWAAPQESRKLPCAHQRGKVYSGKVAMIEMRDITFKEYSFVNMPADDNSNVRKIGVAEESDGWTKPARFFVLDMETEGVLEYTASESRDVLAELRKKDALPLYMGLKGAFISAQVVHEEDLSMKDSVNVDKLDTNIEDDPNSIEENVMPKENSEATNSEDILAVAEELSADLSAPTEDEVIEDASDTEVEESADAEDDAPVEEEESESEELEEGERAEGQEKPHAKDVDPEDSTGADKSREDDESAENVEESDAEVTEEEEADELDANNDDIEPQESELTLRVTELEEENARLRKALHRNLVERVVDTRIALGFAAAESRVDELAEFEGRTASSLADSLRDLAKMEPRVSENRNLSDLTMEQDSEIVGNEENATTIGDEDEEATSAISPVEALENLTVDILMGRKKA